MKVKEFEQFQAAYCGLCHALKKKYGIVGRFVLNYDFTFLFILLSCETGVVESGRRRCIASPLRKKCYCCGNTVLDDAADKSIILTYWRLKDCIADESFLKSLLPRAGKMLLHMAYKKAKHNVPEFDDVVEQKLKVLSEIEQSKTASLDIPADQFAGILASAAAGRSDSLEKERTIFQLLYHVGRFIYILDAADDLHDRFLSGRYNPIAEKFGLK